MKITLGLVFLSILVSGCSDQGLTSQVEIREPWHDVVNVVPNDYIDLQSPLDPRGLKPLRPDPDNGLGSDPLNRPWGVLPPDHPDESIPYDPGSPMVGGHFDAETTSFLAAINNGRVDGHVHEYDVLHDIGGIDYFNILSDQLDNIQDVVDENQKFKILVLKPDLSPGARLVINRTYNPLFSSTYHSVQDYALIDISSLPVFSLSGVDGSHKLERLGLYFDEYSIVDYELIPTKTNCVVRNILGIEESWRNGAITIQIVKVNDNGSDDFDVDHSLSFGGNHGGATSGLLFEGTAFWHWNGRCSHENDWLP